MILAFRASTNCPTVGLLFEPQCKRITPNVFSRDLDSGFESQDSENLHFQRSPHMLDCININNPSIVMEAVA
jgi:hypothetical protein